MTPASVIQRARKAGEAWALEDKAEREKRDYAARERALEDAAHAARDALELTPEDTIDLTWLTDDAIGVTVDTTRLVYYPARRRLVLRTSCPEAAHRVELPVRSLVDLYLALEGARAADECTTCHPDPPEVSTWAVSVVQAGDSRALLEALDAHDPYPELYAAGEYLHIISGRDA